MASSHISVRYISRGSGRSAVVAAAYRHRAKMEFEREARTIDFSAKPDLTHEEFSLPADAPAWIRDLLTHESVTRASEVFWNRVEGFENRVDAALAKDTTIGLPIELSREQNIALVRDFVGQHVTAKGMVADWAYHDKPDNPHIHLMTTLRPLTDEGFGVKSLAVLDETGQQVRSPAGKRVYRRWAGDVEAFLVFRNGWFDCQNQHLALAGFDIRIDGRSFERQGVELKPPVRISNRLEKMASRSPKDVPAERLELRKEHRAENARSLQRKPGIVLDLVTREKSVFDRRDIARVLHRHIDDADLFQNLMAKLLNSPELLRLDRERIDFSTGERALAKYTTRSVIRMEAEMANRAIWLSQQASHSVDRRVLEATLAWHDRLSDEQRTAIEHLASNERIAAVVGRAGAGKTTMMRAAREAWEAAGYRVTGAALAGKAVDGLEKEAGINARTLSSWEFRWKQGRDLLDDKTIFVLDEAGMVASRQMAHFVEAIVKAGAKLVLVGDPDQLQPIEAGAAFRAIADRIGYAELQTIYRQRVEWMREASIDLARGNIRQALDAYHANGRVRGSELKAEALANLISDWMNDYDPNKTSLILAHLRRDVHELNTRARQMLVTHGIVEVGSPFQTAGGTRQFAAGDQIVFLKNDSSLGVKNGMVGKVVEAGPGRIVAELGEPDHRRRVIVEQRVYNDLDHGYAMTIHKSQGATVDQVKVLASLSLDRHLTYVALTRHRDDVAVYYGQRSFAKAGGLAPMLSRRNAKETTLDYAGDSLYRQVLRFAEARGLHLMSVARSLIQDRLQWTIRQKEKVADLAARIAAIGVRLGFINSVRKTEFHSAKEAMPMVSGVTTFSKSIDEAVDDRLAADPGLRDRWEEVSKRFHFVFADPQKAFKAVDFDAMLVREDVAKSTIAKIAKEPETFGMLKGKTGLLAGRAEKADRQLALNNVTALAESVSDYLRQRGELEKRCHADELLVRKKVAVEIPALSPEAKSVLERVRDAIDRNDLASALEFALADKMVKAEIDGFGQAVTERFGERTFLPLAAKDPTGETFRRITADISEPQTREVQSAWSWMRAVQQLAAHERSVMAQKQSETLRQTRSARMTLQ